MFNIFPQFRAKSITDSQTVSAAPARFLDDNGRENEPAVVVFAAGTPRLSITTDAALRLANEIADVLARHKETAK